MVPWVLPSSPTPGSMGPMHVGMLRGTAFPGKSTEMDYVLPSGMKHARAGRRISNSLVHGGTLKLFSAQPTREQDIRLWSCCFMAGLGSSIASLMCS